MERCRRSSSATTPIVTTWPASTSYVTGSHSVKVGFQDAFGPYTAVTSMQFGAATYKRPSTILQGRIIRIGVDVKW